MALDATGTDPCDLLNKNLFPEMWISETEANQNTVIPLIANAGITRTMLSVINGTPKPTLNQDTLTSPDANSKFRLVQFLSGGGVGGSGYKTLDNVLLGTPTEPESIVDTFILGDRKGISKTNYSTAYGNVLTQGDIESIVQKIIDAGYLLKKEELYNPEQLTAANPPPINQQTLIYIYKVQAKGTLSQEQSTQKALLEARNLRFFGAFLAEYCFYRTRYRWLLKHYFNVYKNTYTTSTYTTLMDKVFRGSGSGENEYSTNSTASSLTQADYLKGLSFHLAVLNTRMIDLRRILGQVTSIYSRMITEVQNTINADDKVIGSNTELDKVLNTLKATEKEASKYLSERDFREGAMKYNEEKNRHANILLGLYAFLNISALAMIYKLR